MRIALSLAAALLAASASNAVHGADRPCGKPDAAAAGKAIERVVTWAHLHKAFQDYGHCDRDAVADAYTDALLRLIVDWKNVDAFAGAMQKDPQFREFVYAHLKSPAAKDDLQSVYSRAKASCPAGHDAFCAELAEATRPQK
jgi:hypothetical protein